VDNNCTDNTIEIASKYDFVKVVKEKVQGMTPARNRGFNIAKSDIIAKIDADVRLEEHWLEKVLANYQNPEVSAVGGMAYSKTISQTRGPKTILWTRFYMWCVNAIFRVPVLWGGNYSMRRTCWEAIKNDVCLDDSKVHEDQDVSLLLAGKGYYAVQDSKVLVTVDEWSIHNFPKLIEYTARGFKTLDLHKKKKTLKTKNVNKYPLSYSILFIAVVLIPALIFYTTSLVYYLVGPIFRPFLK
jgi:glycosyltransferase involved in cell wall biosynthesis